MRRTITAILLASIALTGLTACSSRPAGCNAPSDVDLSGSLDAQKAYFENLNSPLGNNTFAFSIEDANVMTYPSCFDGEYVAGYEEKLKREANWDNDPNYGSAPEFLPQGKLSFSTPAAEISLTDDAAALKSAFDKVRSDVKEGNGTDLDYEIEFPAVGSVIQLGADTGRDRDKSTLTLGLALTLRVPMEGEPYFWLSAHFNAKDAENSQLGLEGICNGLLIEVAGEQFKILNDEGCGFLEPSASGFYFDYKIFSDTDLENQNLNHLVKVLATGPFSVFLVDAEGNPHEFAFNKADSKEFAKIALILKAVETGNGY